MSRTRLLTSGAVLALCGALAALAVGAADAALVKVGTLVIRADGGFTPRTLPRHSYAPVRFQGHADIASTNSAPPPALQSARLDFDRDGRLATRGLAVCPPGRIEATTPKQARRRCRNAIVGRGHVRAVITLPNLSRIHVRSPLTLFNGPRQGRNVTVVTHAHAIFPVRQTFVVVVTIERRRGPYRYRATFDVPAIAGGAGALTHVDMRIGRRYRFRGVKRSYTSARCSDGILQTRGRFSFADGTIVAGSIFKPCNVRR